MKSHKAEAVGDSHTARHVPWLVVAIMAVTPWIVGDAFPVSRYAMFAEPDTLKSRYVFEGPDGARVPWREGASWMCETRDALGPLSRRCGVQESGLTHMDRRVARWVNRAGGGAYSPSLQGELVRQELRLEDPWSEAVVEECVVMRCGRGEVDGHGE